MRHREDFHEAAGRPADATADHLGHLDPAGVGVVKHDEVPTGQEWQILKPILLRIALRPAVLRVGEDGCIGHGAHC